MIYYCLLYLGLLSLLVGSKEPDPYETHNYGEHFPDAIVINFPVSSDFNIFHQIGEGIRDYLRQRRIGYVSGMMRGGDDRWIEIGVDLDKIDEHQLIQDLKSEGYLPNDVTLEFHRDRYHVAQP